ncbi:MAG TPA: hemolysin family protein [Candidatus Rifleibacterium sp.]|nr:hemolysin family protein [Candidatus Rifleibacterium sp.]
MLNTALFFIVLLIFSGIFSCSETAITSINEVSISSLNTNSRRHKFLVELLRNKHSVIAAILVGNNIVNTVLAVYAGVFFDQLFVESGLLSPHLAPMIASVITIVFLLIFGEVLPKHLGVTFSKGWAFFITYPIWVIVKLLQPVTWAMNLVSRMLLKLLPFKGEEGAPTIQEILLMAKISEQAGHIDSFERKLMSKSSRFNDLLAGEVMIPRNQVKGVPLDISLQELLDVFRSDMYSRVPVYKDDLDTVVGVFNFKELFKLDPTRPGDFSIARLMLKPLFIPENVVLGELLERMKSKRTHMAVVVDEYGSMAGIITMEDIVERLFGLIGDEYDGEEPSSMQAHANGEIEVAGNISLQELTTSLQVEFPEEVRRQVNTLNGFLILLKGDFPKRKEKITWKNLSFKVREVQGHRAEKVLIRRIN